MKRFLMTAMSAIMALSLMACTDTGKEDEKKSKVKALSLPIRPAER